MKQCPWIWVNGEWVDWASANTHVLTHALHYGSGVFEGIRAYETPKGPAIFKAMDHYTRLMDSCHAYHMTSAYDADTLITATKALIRKNDLPSCYIRPIVFTDYGSMGIIPNNPSFTTAIASWEWGSYLGDDGVQFGISCQISHITKIPSSAMPSTAKSCANYANSYLAKKHVIDAGFDEAILLNQHGYVAEGPGENLFMVKDNTLITPPISDDVLNGITRQTVMELARDLDITVIERSIHPDELFNSQECFFTGTAAEVTPIRAINHQSIGNGQRGPITQRIQSLYFDIVKGQRPHYDAWLTYCHE